MGDIIGARPARAGAGEGKEADEGAGAPPAFLDPARIFTRVSVWEASDEVPDPEALRARDEAEDALLDDEDDFHGDVAEHADGPTVDVTGGEGYTQVYFVMAPTPGGARTAVETDAGSVTLVPRRALFRYGSWVYGGEVRAARARGSRA